MPAEPPVPHRYGHQHPGDLIHVIDDHSRVAYVQARDDETNETVTEVLRNGVAWFVVRGVTVHRVLGDNGGRYKSHLWRET